MVLPDAAQDAVMSPICWTAGNRVPFDLTVGEHDSARVRLSNRRMAELLKLQPGGVTLHDMPSLSHFDTHTCLHDAGAAWYMRLEMRLKNESF
jgi:arylformamidase